MSWQTPSFVEINMSAEIGAYQDDSDEERYQDRDPVTHRDQRIEVAQGIA